MTNFEDESLQALLNSEPPPIKAEINANYEAYATAEMNAEAAQEVKTQTEKEFIEEISNKKFTLEQLFDVEMLKKVCRITNPAKKEITIQMLKQQAKLFGSGQGFRKLLTQCDKEVEQEKTEQKKKQAEQQKIKKPTRLNFTDSPLVLQSSLYSGDDNGIYNEKGNKVINHPVIITKIIKDASNKNSKIEIATRSRIFGWEFFTFPRAILTSKRKIGEISAYGLDVVDSNAGDWVEYLRSLEVENEFTIPIIKGIPHLGWVDNKFKEFAPYSDKYEFCGDESYRSTFEAVSQRGEFEVWKALLLKVRDDSFAARSMINASFASALLAILNKSIFITHLWGTSGVGKSVLLNFAASIWGNPEGYVKTLNTTSVGAERNATFFRNLPVMLDELQTVRSKDTLTNFIYNMTQGSGRSRGTIEGIEKLNTWKCGFLTTGEQPLASENSGTGEINRVIDIVANKNIFKDIRYVIETIEENYGTAGKYFIENLEDYEIEEMHREWLRLIPTLDDTSSGKQYMSASILLLADELVNRMFFDMTEEEAKENTINYFKELCKTLVSKSESDLAKRGGGFILNWAAENIDKFVDDDKENERQMQIDEENSRGNSKKKIDFGVTKTTYGRKTDHDTIIVSRGIFDKVITEAGFNSRAVIRALNEGGYTIKDEGSRIDKTARINDMVVRVVEIKLGLHSGESEENLDNSIYNGKIPPPAPVKSNNEAVNEIVEESEETKTIENVEVENIEIIEKENLEDININTNEYNDEYEESINALLNSSEPIDNY